MAGRKEQKHWVEEKKRRFTEAWNDDVTLGALKERFGVKNPASQAQSLRRQGYPVKDRKGNLRLYD
jgi:hypothetical protein